MGFSGITGSKIKYRFAVITPTVGKECLDAAIASVKGQTTKQKVIHIVVADGPLGLYDRCLDTRYLELDSPQKGYGGPARNLGMQCVEDNDLADYIIFLDDDNVLFPDALQRYDEAAKKLNDPPLMCQKIVYHDKTQNKWDLIPHSLPPRWMNFDTLNCCFRKDTLTRVRWASYCGHDFQVALEAIHHSNSEFIMVDGIAGVRL